MKEMVGGCCVCSDDRGWAENPLVYCDGSGCTVAVHQACYGIVTVPTGNWYCRKCESADKTVKVCCELCPNKDGALKPTDNNAWAHVVCALYIPEVRFGNVTTMEPIILSAIPAERYNRTCYICENSKVASIGACMTCNKHGCKQQFHVTCAQSQGLLCEEAGHYMDNVKYCGYCLHHYTKLRKGGNVKVIPPYRPVNTDPDAKEEPSKTTTKRKLSTGGSSTSSSSSIIKGSRNMEDATNEEEIPSKEPLLPPQDQKLTNTKRKKGSRTPPVNASSTGVSPAASPRPITPSNPPSSSNSISSVQNINNGGLLVPISIGTNSAPVPVSIQTNSSLPGQVSAAAIVASNTSSASTAPALVEPKRQQGVVKETRPNSIVVNVPLEVAMQSTKPIVPNIVQPLPHQEVLTPADKPSSPGLLITAEPNEQLRKLQLQSQAITTKRSRSQSTETIDKPTIKKATKRLTSNERLKSVSPAPQIVKNDQHNRHHHNHVQSHHHDYHQQQDHQSSIVNHHESKQRKTSNHISNSIKEEDNKSSTVSTHLLGNQLNSSSSMIQKMSDALGHESSSHSLFNNTSIDVKPHLLLGPSIPNRLSSHPKPTENHGSGWGSSAIPQTLEQLLERQWEQGSQFLMEQAQHFDIASLLSCLHQLRAENAQLEENVQNLIQRRDHLLAVNARLAIPLVTPQGPVQTNNTNTSPNVATQQPPIVENGLPPSSPHHQDFRRSQSQFTTAQNSVLVRTSSAEPSRRSTQSPAYMNSVPYQNSSTHQNHGQVVMRRDVITELHASGNNRGPNQPS